MITWSTWYDCRMTEVLWNANMTDWTWAERMGRQIGWLLWFVIEIINPFKGSDDWNHLQQALKSFDGLLRCINWIGRLGLKLLYCSFSHTHLFPSSHVFLPLAIFPSFFIFSSFPTFIQPPLLLFCSFLPLFLPPCHIPISLLSQTFFLSILLSFSVFCKFYSFVISNFLLSMIASNFQKPTSTPGTVRLLLWHH